MRLPPRAIQARALTGHGDTTASGLNTWRDAERSNEAGQNVVCARPTRARRDSDSGNEDDKQPERRVEEASLSERSNR